MIKKRVYLLLVILMLAICLGISILISSRDNFANLKDDVKNIKLYPYEIVTENMVYENDVFRALTNDPQIIIKNIDAHVNTVGVGGDVLISLIDVVPAEIYYTTEEGESFSTEKSFSSYPGQKGGDVYYNVNRYVYDIRIDIHNIEGYELPIEWVAVNPTNYIFSMTSYFATVAAAIFLVCIFIVIIKRKVLIRNLRMFMNYRGLLYNLVSRDLKVKYRRSVLGFLWSVLNPLLMMMVITAVFSNIFKFDIKDFPLYYLTGTLIFNFITESTNGALTSIIGAAPLIKKVYIPKYIFPLEKVLFAFVNMLFSLVAVAIMFLVIGAELHWTIILFPIPMIYAAIFSVGFSLILASVNVFFRDVGHLYSVFTTAWMYLTPIIYPVSILPEQMMVIMRLNPAYYYVTYIREVMLYGRVPNIQFNAICIGFSLLFLAIGLLMFKRQQDKFILYI